MLKFIYDAIKRDRKNEKGFSLIELIVVVAILGILVAIAIPVYGAIQTTARHRALETASANGATAMASALANGTSATDEITALNAKKDGYTYGGDPTRVAKDGRQVGAGPVNTSTDDVFVSATNSSSESAWAGTAYGSGNSWSSTKTTTTN